MYTCWFQVWWFCVSCGEKKKEEGDERFRIMKLDVERRTFYRYLGCVSLPAKYRKITDATRSSKGKRMKKRGGFFCWFAAADDDDDDDDDDADDDVSFEARGFVFFSFCSAAFLRNRWFFLSDGLIQISSISSDAPQSYLASNVSPTRALLSDDVLNASWPQAPVEKETRQHNTRQHKIGQMKNKHMHNKVMLIMMLICKHSYDYRFFFQVHVPEISRPNSLRVVVNILYSSERIFLNASTRSCVGAIWRAWCG